MLSKMASALSMRTPVPTKFSELEAKGIKNTFENVAEGSSLQFYQRVLIELSIHLE